MKIFLTTRTLLIFATIATVLFSQAQQSHAETYWLQSERISPPYPFDPYGGAIKIKTLDEKDG
jgi:hypothetical protein